MIIKLQIMAYVFVAIVIILGGCTSHSTVNQSDIFNKTDTIQYQNNNSQGDNLVQTSFIIWMGAAKWTERDGKNKGIYEAKLNNANYRLYLISLGEQKYGTKLEGTFITNLDDENLTINLKLIPSANHFDNLNSYPFFILRTHKNQSVKAKLVDDNGKDIELLKNYNADYYDQIMEVAIKLGEGK